MQKVLCGMPFIGPVSRQSPPIQGVKSTPLILSASDEVSASIGQRLSIKECHNILSKNVITQNPHNWSGELCKSIVVVSHSITSLQGEGTKFNTQGDRKIINCLLGNPPLYCQWIIVTSDKIRVKIFNSATSLSGRPNCRHPPSQGAGEEKL